MIISHTQRFVYCGLPKTASTSLHKWLSQPIFGVGKWSWDKHINDQHNTSVPIEVQNYFIFASIRHPFDRAVSLWAHSQTPDAVDIEKMSFEEFIIDFQPTASYFYASSQYYLLNTTHIHAFVHFHNLLTDIFALPPICSLKRRNINLELFPHINSCKHIYYKELITPSLQKIIRERWADDWLLTDWE